MVHLKKNRFDLAEDFLLLLSIQLKYEIHFTRLEELDLMDDVLDVASSVAT